MGSVIAMGNKGKVEQKNKAGKKEKRKEGREKEKKGPSSKRISTQAALSPALSNTNRPWVLNNKYLFIIKAEAMIKLYHTQSGEL